MSSTLLIFSYQNNTNFPENFIYIFKKNHLLEKIYETLQPIE